MKLVENGNGGGRQPITVVAHDAPEKEFSWEFSPVRVPHWNGDLLLRVRVIGDEVHVFAGKYV